MARVFKFRVWLGRYKKMVDPFTFDREHFPRLENPDTVLMQYVGYYAVNGEICEGDIVKRITSDSSKGIKAVHIGVIEYDADWGAFCFRRQGTTTALGCGSGLWYEKIGNIFQNSELLRERVKEG